MHLGADRFVLQRIVLASILALALPRPARAILFDATGDPSHNTTAPTGGLSGSGWAFEGLFGNFLGTAIAPHYFLTARHIGGDTNWGFLLDGTNYHPVASYDDPSSGSDLRLWRVADRLPRYAPVYTGASEVGAPLIAIGRGTQRGAAVVTSGKTNGWYWGAEDLVMRWGSNCVNSIVSVAGAPYLAATFDHGAGPDECHLSGGDSGGAVFVLLDGVWQLDGIHYSVEGPFNTNTNGSGFNAAIYDHAHLYYQSGSTWLPYSGHGPSSFISSRVSSHYAWLTNTIADFDSNTNGLPDWWKLRYSGSIHGLSATADPDGDGMNNLAEWIARTDPTNAASFFRIAGLIVSNGMASLSFAGWTDRLYRVEARASLSNSALWLTASTNDFAGNGGITAWTDTNLTATITTRVYRLKAILPP